MSVTASRLSTTGNPMVRFGTKWLSMTSTCNQSAPSTAAAWSARRAKSAARIDGAINGGDVRFTLIRLAQRGREHRVGAVTVWPQLHVQPVAEAIRRFEQGPGVGCRDG